MWTQGKPRELCIYMEWKWHSEKTWPNQSVLGVDPSATCTWSDDICTWTNLDGPLESTCATSFVHLCRPQQMNFRSLSHALLHAAGEHSFLAVASGNSPRGNLGDSTFLLKFFKGLSLCCCGVGLPTLDIGEKESESLITENFQCVLTAFRSVFESANIWMDAMRSSWISCGGLFCPRYGPSW